MKTGYIKPKIEIEKYELNASIAANCGPIVSIGPDDGNGNTCKEFVGSWEEPLMTLSLGTSFYENGAGVIPCDCYYSSGGEGYFTS